MPGFNVDWKNPDYAPVYRERARRLEILRKDPKMLALIKMHYAAHPADFIDDYALTVDPRVKGRSPVMPFLLFPRQVEAVQWIGARHAAGEPGIMVKSRDVGASWIAIAWAVTKCLFTKDFMVGFGSATEDKVDRSGDPDTLFYKARMFLQYIPEEFRGGWSLAKHSAHMRLVFPATGSSITGDSGDRIGRGGRKSVWFIDESAHLERPMIVDASLAASTDCRIDMSSVNGTANSFFERAHSIAPAQRFDFTWADDPRKDAEWLARKKAELDPVVFKQEILCDFNATVDNAVITSDMIAAAVGLHLRLGISLTGQRRSALDVADVGRDKCAVGSRNGNILDYIRSWSGADLDISASVSKAVAIVEELGGRELTYDADGMGANVRGDVRVMEEIRKEKNPRSLRTVRVIPFRGRAPCCGPRRTPNGPRLKTRTCSKILRRSPGGTSTPCSPNRSRRIEASRMTRTS